MPRRGPTRGARRGRAPRERRAAPRRIRPAARAEGDGLAPARRRRDRSRRRSWCGLGVVMIYSTTAPLAIGRAAPAPLRAPPVRGGASPSRSRRSPLRVPLARLAPRRAAALGLLGGCCWSRRWWWAIEVNGAQRWLAVPRRGHRASSPPSSPSGRPCWPSRRCSRRSRSARRRRCSRCARRSCSTLPPSACCCCSRTSATRWCWSRWSDVLLFVRRRPAARAGRARRSSRRGRGRSTSRCSPYALARVRGFLRPLAPPRRTRASSSCSPSSPSAAAAALGVGPRRRPPEALLPARGAHRLHPLGGRRGARPRRRAARARRLRRAARRRQRASRAGPATASPLLAFGMTALHRGAGDRQRGGRDGARADQGLHPALPLLRRELAARVRAARSGSCCASARARRRREPRRIGAAAARSGPRR